MTKDVETLVFLQKNLSRQTEISTILESVPPHLQEIHESYTSMKDQRDEIRQNVEDAVRAQRELERELEDLREEKKVYRTQLMQVTNQKEYGAVLKEIDSIDEKIRIIEDDLMTRMETIEKGEKTLTGELEAWEKLEDEYREKMSVWESEKDKLREELARLQDDQRLLEHDLPQDLKTSFKRLLTVRQGLAAVPIVQYTCSGCNVRLRPQHYAEVRSGKTVSRCDGCSRYLYYDEQKS